MRSRYRWLVVLVFFAFMLLHQADKLLIGPLTTPIMEEFGINEAQMGLIFSAAILVAAAFYLIWGYLYDRYARPKLLALASFIWGATTWLSALAPTFPLFVASRSSTGIDDASYAGLYSLTSDYFEPRMRGKVYGLLYVAAPMGYMLGLILASTVGRAIGWRKLFFITGSIGILLAFVILAVVKEMPRGRAEPELAGLETIGAYRFNFRQVRELFRKRSLILLFIQGFFGVFPWNVLTYWAFRYLETERGYDTGQATLAMASTVATLAIGYFVGGLVGDYAFKRTRRGRILVSLVGVLAGAAFLFLAVNAPLENQGLFMVLLGITALFMPFGAPNVTATVHDIVAPEVRSTALSVQYLVEQIGAFSAPALAGVIAVHSSLRSAILLICIGAWLICAVFLSFVARIVPKDIKALRQLMRQRGEEARHAGA